MNVRQEGGSRGATSARSAGEVGIRREGLRALILLAGAVRKNPLIAATDRAVLDLPVDSEGSLLDLWCAQASDLAGYLGQESLDMRVLVNRTGPRPTEPRLREDLTLSIERERSELRGTGGALRDAVTDYEDEDYILVAHAAKVPLVTLTEEARVLDRVDGAVRIVAQPDGTPSGVTMIRCGALRTVPELGFVDLKEQALPIIAHHESVVVIRHNGATAEPLRSLGDYIGALRTHHLQRREKKAEKDPFAEVWRPAFSVVEPGAEVDPTAVIHDGVVISGGTVEAGAMVVRSLVCPGARVERNRQVIDEVVVEGAHGKRRSPTSSIW